MLRRVNFIGSGYECVRFVMVDTPTMAEAYAAAEKWYMETGQDFPYCEMEIPKEYAYNESAANGKSLNERLLGAQERVAAFSSCNIGKNVDFGKE